MKLPALLPQRSHATRTVMVIAWFLIAIKSVVVWQAIEHWHMPFHPMWIIGPTLAFAALATRLWLAHREE